MWKHLPWQPLLQRISYNWHCDHLRRNAGTILASQLLSCTHRAAFKLRQNILNCYETIRSNVEIRSEKQKVENLVTFLLKFVLFYGKPKLTLPYLKNKPPPLSKSLNFKTFWGRATQEQQQVALFYREFFAQNFYREKNINGMFLCFATFLIKQRKQTLEF